MNCEHILFQDYRDTETFDVEENCEKISRGRL